MINVIQNFIVLDDDPVNNMICTKIIKKIFPEAYVLTFTDPDIAVSYIASTYESATASDAVLFLDINMPGLSGWDFLDAFESFDIRIKTHLKIFMLTSSFDPRDKKRATENINVLGYFEKPLSVEKIESVRNVVNSVISAIAD